MQHAIDGDAARLDEEPANELLAGRYERREVVGEGEGFPVRAAAKLC